MKRTALLIATMLLIGLAFLAQTTSSAQNLRQDICTAALPDRAETADIIGARFQCGADAPTDSSSWLWLRLNAAQLADLPPSWSLLVDQTRFEQISILVVGEVGTTRTTRSPAQLAEHSSPGGLLKFTVAPPGDQISGLYLGFRQIDDLSLMRKIVATSATAQAATNARWLLLMGLFAGTMLSALLYNLVISTGVRYGFQRWYVLWVATAFAYGMVWTNVAAVVVPGLAGPMAVRLDFLLVGLMVATGNMFFLAVIERGMLPQKLVLAGRLLAVSGALMGFMAALDMVFPAVLTDRLLNFIIAGTALVVGASCWFAVRRGSRVVWFYLIGWSPVICVFLARLSRNLGLSPQNDLVDMATFAALAFEALILSLAIADRFRMVAKKLEAARRRAAIDAAEAQTLRIAAHTDFLTGLGNRAAFQESATELLERAEPFSLFLIDVDYLKAINDRFGHAGGDALLREVASALAHLAKAHPDMRVARIGGDEFVILSVGGTSNESIIASELDGLQGKVWQCGDQQRTLSLSIGSAKFPEDATQIDQLHQNADLGLYNAKRLGRSRYVRYDPLQRVLHDLQIEFGNDVDAALERGEFWLQFQPIVDLGSGTVRGHEALLRWDHPKYGVMLPDRFAGVLEADKLGLRIQDHVLDLALAWLGEQRDPIGTLGVNFTAPQLVGPLVAKHVLDRLVHYDVSPSSLCIEVSESVLLDRSSDAIMENLKILHEAGVRIALDSFGTGFTSLAHLRQMPVDCIKIDSSLTAGIDQGGGRTQLLVRAIVGLANGLGKTLIADGVEDHAQAQRLKDLGCQLGQGLLFDRCAPASDQAESEAA